MLSYCFEGHKMELGSYNQFPCKMIKYCLSMANFILIHRHVHPDFRLLVALNTYPSSALPSWPCLLLFCVFEAEKCALRRLCCFNINCGITLWRDSLVVYLSLALK